MGNAPLFQKPGLGVGTVENRAVLIGISAVLYIPDNSFRFFIGRFKLTETHQLPFLIGRPQRFILPPTVMLNHLIGRMEDVLGGTVILLQLNHLCTGK